MRQAWHLLSDERSRGAVEVAERYADGAADLAALGAAQAAAADQGGAWATCTPTAPRCRCGAEMVLRQGPRDLFFGCATYPRCRGVRLSLYTAAGAAARAAASAVGPSGSAGWRAAHDAEPGQQCRLLRDLFGPLPFRAVRIDPAWLVWNGGTVKRFAEGVYGERAFDRLPVLGDALEEAGCTDADILGHLSGLGPHVRGCWAVDLLLRKG